jgi:hypothetical protein
MIQKVERLVSPSVSIDFGNGLSQIWLDLFGVSCIKLHL